MTTAFFAVAAAAMIALESSRVRNPKMPGARSPLGRVMFLIGGMNERLPVAMMSLSYSSMMPPLPVNLLADPVDREGADPGVEPDSVLLVPGKAVEEYLARVLRAGDDVREQDTVVVAIWLVAEHR